MANMGAASIRVFLDKNLNGAMDEGDEPIKGAGFTVNGGNHLARTDAAGIAWLGACRHQQRRHRRSIRHAGRPAMAAAAQGRAHRAAAGQGQPDRFRGQRDRRDRRHHLFLVKGKQAPDRRPAARAGRRQRKVVATIASAADGYYVITGVLPRRLLLRIARPAQAPRPVGHRHAPGHDRPDGTVLNGRDFDVQPGRRRVSAGNRRYSAASPHVVYNARVGETMVG
jgi:hypothetical protein